MKLRLHVDDFPLTGYTNIRVTPEKALEIDKIDFYVDRGEAEEIIVEGVIDYIRISQVESVIKLWSSLIQKQGRLVIVGTDIQEVSKALGNYNINVPDANQLLYGDTDFPKRVCFSAAHLSSFLKEKCGLKLLKKRVNGYTYMVEAQRK